MTNQPDHDLRALLTQRASEVTADVSAGEQAIATRLAAGDTGLAEVVAMGSSRRGPLLVAAAVLLVGAVGAAVLMSRGDDTVDTGPAASTPTPPAAVLEFRPVLSQFSCAGMSIDTVLTGPDGSVCYQVGDPLPGNQLVESAQAFEQAPSCGELVCIDDGREVAASTAAPTFGLALTLTADGMERFNLLATQCYERSSFSCPSGQLAIVVDDVVISAPTIQQPSFQRDQIQITGDFTEDEANALAASLDPSSTSGPTTPASADDPTAGTPGESAKDVAERFAREVLDEEWITMAADDRDDATFVTLETEGGADVVARLVFDLGIGAFRLTDVASPGLTATETAGETFVDLPVAGSVTISGFDDRLVTAVPYVQAGAIVPAGTAGPYVLPDDDTAWLSILVQTEDGTALRLLSRR